MQAPSNGFNADEKILKYLQKLDYFFNGHKTLIVTELDLTNRCNNCCPGCCGVKENGAELSKEQLDRIISGLKEMDNKGVILSGGGEPLMSPLFTYALRELRRAGMKIGLNSNGLALTPELAREIAENCTYFRISLDAGSPEMYRRTHGMPAQNFEKVCDNITMFSQIRQKVNSETGRNTSFGVGFLTSAATSVDMENFVKIARNRGADFAQFRPFTGDFYDATPDYERLKKEYETPSFQVKASIQKYREMKTNGGRTYDKCRGMFFSTVITADAKVFACLHHRQEADYEIGNLQEQTLPELFQSARIREIYNKMNCEKCPPLCRNDVFNRTLNALSLDITHAEFL